MYRFIHAPCLADAPGATDELASNPLLPKPGDPEKGKQVFTTRACATCHRVDGSLSMIGPDLKDISRTIQAAANQAQPGDIITVHEGVYHERVNPPRSGTSVDKRIVYQAAPGGKVVIKGSEPVKGWVKEKHDTWKVVISNKLFGGFNPYADVIGGEWYETPKGKFNRHTVRGFTMRHAATPWAGAMSEQIGLLGTHWSKGWIIEDNTIRRCSRISSGQSINTLMANFSHSHSGFSNHKPSNTTNGRNSISTISSFRTCSVKS